MRCGKGKYCRAGDGESFLVRAKRVQEIRDSSPSFEMASLLLGFAGWRCKAAATRAPTLAELLALLGGHALPALVHALFDSPPNIGARRDTHTQVSEQNPAESEQSDGLPE